MYVFSVDIPFKGSQSLAKMMPKVTAVSYLHSGVNNSAVPITAVPISGVNDSAVHITAESVTPLEFF
jgi:hypothetical protein